VDKPVRLWTSGFPAGRALLATLILKRWLGGCGPAEGRPGSQKAASLKLSRNLQLPLQLQRFVGWTRFTATTFCVF